MTKNEFIKKLRSKLHVLQESEVDEIINEYSDHIAQKIADGKTEAEAIEDFGDIDELASEILSAYHIKGSAKTVEDYFNSFVQFVNEVTNKVMGFDRRQVVDLIVEFVILIVILGLIRFALTIIVKNVGGALGFVTLGVLTPLAWLLNFIFSVLFFCVSIYVIYLFLQRKLLKKEEATEPISNKEGTTVKKEEKTVVKIKEAKTRANFSAPDAQKEVDRIIDVEPVAERMATAETVEKKQVNSTKETSSNKSDGANDLLMMLVRLFLGLFVWLPAFATLLGAIVVFGLVISLIVAGYQFVWLLFIVFGGILICLAFVIPLTKVIWGKNPL